MQMRLRTCLSTVLTCACAAGSEGPSANTKTYTGQFSANVVETTVSTSLVGGGTFPCTNTYTMSGTMTVTLDARTGAATSTNASVTGTQAETTPAAVGNCPLKGSLSIQWSPTLTGSASALAFSAQNVAINGSYSVTSKTSFNGALANGVVTGTLGFSVSGAGTIGTTSITQAYNTSTAVTLR